MLIRYYYFTTTLLLSETGEPIVPVFLTHQWYTRRPALMRWLQCVHLCHVHLTPTSEFGLPAMKLTEITSAVNRVLHKTQFSCGFRLQLIIRILYLSVTLLWNLCFVISTNKSSVTEGNSLNRVDCLFSWVYIKRNFPLCYSILYGHKSTKVSFHVSFLWWL